MITWMVILAHLCSLQSFGVPYLSPVAPLRMGDMGDHLYRRPWGKMLQRPNLLAERNIGRQQRGKQRKK